VNSAPRRISLAGPALLLLLGPASAFGYVRELTSTGVPIAWQHPCVTMHVFLGNPPPMLSGVDYFAASTVAAATWSFPQIPGTDIRLTTIAEVESTAGVGYDKRNVIVFRQDTWCRDPAPVNDAGVPEPDCYPANALAVTSIFKNVKTGEIVDADIEFNAVDYTWGDLVGQPLERADNTTDFQNALTHEMGHVLGLDHNCYTINDGQSRQKDNTGAPEVDCYNNPSLPATVADATMYPSVAQNDVARRDLSADDVQGVTDIYPHMHDVCPVPADEGGCQLGTSQVRGGRWPHFALGTVATALLALLGRRARHRKI
jgi:hypothetical protein